MHIFVYIGGDMLLKNAKKYNYITQRWRLNLLKMISNFNQETVEYAPLNINVLFYDSIYTENMAINLIC